MVKKKEAADLEKALAEQAEGELAEKAELNAEEAAIEEEKQRSAEAKKDLTDEEIQAQGLKVRENHDAKQTEYLHPVTGDVVAVKPHSKGQN